MKVFSGLSAGLICTLVLMSGCEKKEEEIKGVKENAPPVIISAEIFPKGAYTADTLRVEVKSKDPDGDQVTLSYQWEINGVDIEGETRPTLGARNLAKGSRIAVRVTPSDGKIEGEPFRSEQIVVTNRAPQVVSVTIKPYPVYTRDNLTLTVEGRDPDGDVISYTYQWIKNDTDIPDETSESLAGSNFVKEDAISIRVTPSDGEDEGTPFTRTSIAIANTPPTITSTPPLALGPGGSYSYQVRASDADGDSFTFELTRSPSGMIIDPKSGLIQWKPTEDDAGAHEIVVSASDEEGAQATQSYIFNLSFPTE